MCKIVFKLIFALNILTLVLTSNASDFTVQAVYFKPHDAADIALRLADKIHDVQMFYRNEMLRHGFEPKTFKMERDVFGSIVVHVFHAKFPTEEYKTHTQEKVLNELPDKFKDDKRVNIIFIGGVQSIIKKRCCLGKVGIGWVDGTSGTVLAVANTVFTMEIYQEKREQMRQGKINSFRMDTPTIMEIVLAHELGHAFGFYHNENPEIPSKFALDDFKDPVPLMGTYNLPIPIQSLKAVELSKIECRWLDKHIYFNNDVSVGETPTLEGEPFYKAVMEGRKEFIHLNINISSQYPLHQIQVASMDLDGLVLNWTGFNDESGDVSPYFTRYHFKSPGNNFGTVSHLIVAALDIEGNHMVKFINVDSNRFDEVGHSAPSLTTLKLLSTWGDLKKTD